MAHAGLAALAIDLSIAAWTPGPRPSVLRTRSALAGADAFRDYPGRPEATDDGAGDWAFRHRACEHGVRQGDRHDGSDGSRRQRTYAWGTVTTVDVNEVTIQIIRGLRLDRATAKGAGLGEARGDPDLLRAGCSAWHVGHVQAMATAHASPEAPETNCMKPFVMPDMWFESDKTTQDNDPANDYLDPTAATQRWRRAVVLRARRRGRLLRPLRGPTAHAVQRDTAAAARGTPTIGAPR